MMTGLLRVVNIASLVLVMYVIHELRMFYLGSIQCELSIVRMYNTHQEQCQTHTRAITKGKKYKNKCQMSELR